MLHMFHMVVIRFWTCRISTDNGKASPQVQRCPSMEGWLGKRPRSGPISRRPSISRAAWGCAAFSSNPDLSAGNLRNRLVIMMIVQIPKTVILQR